MASKLELSGTFAFLAGSVATLATASNIPIMIGGAGLTLAASVIGGAQTLPNLTSSITQKLGISNPFTVATYSSLAANVALTGNGLNMMANGIQDGNTTEVIAGGLLASANSIFYGTANIGNLLNKISEKSHGILSAIAGASITAAGITLKDPSLTAIGAAFAYDGITRSLPAINSNQPK